MKNKDENSNQIYLLLALAALLIVSLVIFLAVVFFKEDTEAGILHINKLTEKHSTPKKDIKTLQEKNIVIGKKREENVINAKIDQYILKNNLDSNIGIFISSMDSDEKYMHNKDKNFSAVGVYRVPLAMAWYDKVYSGQRSLSDTLLFKSQNFEAGGPIGNLYKTGSYIELDTLLHTLIIDSDNSAARILYDQLGGWYTFKKIISRYSSTTQDNAFYSINNVANANFLNDTLYRLYDNPKYNTLIKDLQATTTTDLIDTNTKNPIAQHMGQHGITINLVSIVYAKRPYTITILSTMGAEGKKHIQDINKIAYDYYNK